MSTAANLSNAIAWVMLLLWLAAAVPVQSAIGDNEVTEYTDRPIVGILAQEIPASRTEWKQYKSLIPASYVKFVEGAGARVVPVWINRTRSYYENLMTQINGILFTGGSSDLNAKFGVADAGAIIYDIAQTLNSQGHHFPLWGTCQGFELLAYLGANRTNPLTRCRVGSVNLKLEFLPSYRNSTLLGSAPKDIIQILSNKAVSPNFHEFCLTQENVTRFMGDINWRLISLNTDANGLKFVSIMESRKFPAYGVQFHPEKVLFEWHPEQKTAHSVYAVRAAQYFANFFVNEARKNSHSFSSSEDEVKALIYNYSPQYTGKEKNSFSEQIYLFEW